MITVKEIKKMHIKEKIKVMEMIKKDVIEKEASIYSVDNVLGCAKNLWGKDAQEYIKKLRRNDRL